MDYHADALGSLTDILNPRNMMTLAAVSAMRLLDEPRRKKQNTDKRKQKAKRKTAEAMRKRNRRK